MWAIRNALLRAAAGLLVPVWLAGCLGVPGTAAVAPAPGADTLPPVALDTAPDGQALLYAFNASGWTLLGSKYAITVDGQHAASLPRGSYTTLVLMPGTHELSSGDMKVVIAMEAGHLYFVSAAYDPGKGWLWPFAGRPFVFKEIDEATARVMLRTFKYAAPAVPAQVSLGARDAPSP